MEDALAPTEPTTETAPRRSGRATATKPTTSSAVTPPQKPPRKTPSKKQKTDRKILALFDVDGTLTEPRKVVTREMKKFIKDLKQDIVVGVVGGSDLVKQREQLGDAVTSEFDYSFSENGLVAFKNGELFHTKSMKEHLGDEKLQEFINFVLGYLAKVQCPVKRGTFVEYRVGMLNISPVGRSCSMEERDQFEKFDQEAKVREKMVQVLEEKFGDEFGLKFSIGGQISFDVFPKGWDKTYCLQFVEKEGYDEIHFFGDKTFKGGNDYEIFNDPRVKGHTVTSWQDTMQQCKDLFMPKEEQEAASAENAPAAAPAAE